MEILGMILVGIGGITVLVGSIWFLVVTFQESLLWGLGCMFVPFVSLIFSGLALGQSRQTISDPTGWHCPVCCRLHDDASGLIRRCPFRMLYIRKLGPLLSGTAVAAIEWILSVLTRHRLRFRPAERCLRTISITGWRKLDR